MAYVHCHGCGWQQDDFWSRHYNPATVLWSDIRCFGRPFMLRERRIFSWFWLARCFAWRISAPFRQKWWTYESWKKALAQKKGGCPKCQNRLCID